MVTFAVVCCGLLSALPHEVDATAPDLAAYEATYREAKSKVGRDPDAHVRLALWCEAHGLAAERLKHLAIASMIDPGHAAARGLMGLVAHAGDWRRPEAVTEQVKADGPLAQKIAEYKSRRDKAPMKADAQWKLALWCEQAGLAAEAKAHLTIVTRLDPEHAAARKRLGYKKQGGRWTTAEQLAEQRRESERQRQADREWKPRLEKWREMLAAKDEKKRAEAKRAMAEVVDPRAVPAAWSVFGNGRAGRQMVAVQLLGQIDGTDASRALAGLAVFGPAAEVRQAAMQTLARRDPREFAGLLIDRLRDPVRYEIRPVGGPGSPGVLYVEGKEYNVRRFYRTPGAESLADIPRIFAPSVPFDPFGAQNIHMAYGSLNPSGRRPLSAQALHGLASRPSDARAIIARDVKNQGGDGILRDQYGLADTGEYVVADMDQNENFTLDSIMRFAMAGAARRDFEIGLAQENIQRAALDAQQKLNRDVSDLEWENSSIHQLNARILPVLESSLGENFGEDRMAWQAWWTDQEGYAPPPAGRAYKPTIDEIVEVPVEPTFVTSFQIPTRRRHACFGGGTSVRTLGGLMAIENVKVGDRLLTQDPHTGVLCFESVLAVFDNPPSETHRISLGGESIVATGIHRFWKAGKGWVMVRDLKVGDVLRTLGGVTRVTTIEDDETQPVFNLEVAGGSSFFVGRQGALVHDNSLVQPTPEPFDAAPDLAKIRDLSVAR